MTNISQHNAFLNQSDLVQLTGRKRHSAQTRWLSEHGYRFDVNAIGHPVVLWAALERKLAPSKSSRTAPNFRAVTNG